MLENVEQIYCCGVIVSWKYLCEQIWYSDLSSALVVLAECKYGWKLQFHEQELGC